MRKRLWSPDEDEKLQKYVSQHGFGNWSEVAKKTGLQRCGKSCRLRWINYLRPELKRGRFSPEEKLIIVNLQKVFGNSWSKIAAHLPGRTDSDIKNFWHSHFRKKRPQQISAPPSITKIQESMCTIGEGSMPRNPNVTSIPGFHAPELSFCNISATPQGPSANEDPKNGHPYPTISMLCFEDENQYGKHEVGAADPELMSALCNGNWYKGSNLRDRVSSSVECNPSSCITNDSLFTFSEDAALPPDGLELVVWSCLNRSSQSEQRASSGTVTGSQCLQMINPQMENRLHANPF